MSRTQQEICERFTEVRPADMFGFRLEVLAGSLDVEHLKQVGIDLDDPGGWTVLEGEALTDDARKYLQFAVSKIRDHRGISAHRSVDKLGEYAWLLGRDDVVAAMDAAEYENYGAPKVKAFADGMGWTWPDHEDLARMAGGLPCSDDCEDGCGS